MKKKILFIAPSYFNYYKIIINELISQGHDVTYFCDINSGYLYNFCRKFKWLNHLYIAKLYKSLKKITTHDKFDTLFIISGKIFSDQQWKDYLSECNISSKILYQWDSVQNHDYRRVISCYDKVITFDRKDANTFGLKYLPLFHNASLKGNSAPDIDLFFIGIWHSDRIKILEKVYNQAIKKNLNCCFRVYYPFYLYLWIKYIRREKMESNFWIFRKLSTPKTQKLYQRSKCIVDINHPSQTGLTMRTIESVGYNKKLITTNENIKYEPFYSADNIQIIDRENIFIDFDFLNSACSYQNLNEYHISNWVKQILS